jgi:hypothetical protein
MKELPLNTHSGFHPGFRLSIFDALILMSGTLSVVYFEWDSSTFPLLIALGIIHIFLFCKVLRIERRE